MIVERLPLFPPERLDGVVFLLRATCTSEVIAYMDEHSVWPLLASAKSKDGTTPYGTGERARREFIDFSESNAATLARATKSTLRLSRRRTQCSRAPAFGGRVLSRSRT